ncbi:hypothetical protein [Brevibacillus panacihumi]|uniref:Uncharacterized protein n=1 Tax=Brevibacillus panacihumi TaxID=497735 RepID=A0A3M8CRJ7_9BACL|nr:hypothetical protein [Brevibacillus panacihumi]RNB78406.1 hypothetical protein EDM58_11420 [Brevibacillus panacihumi]
MLKKFTMLGILALSLMVQPFAAQTHAAQNDQEALAKQLSMLESGIVPTTAAETVHTWARAVTERNGALQYALLSENAKQSVKASFSQFGWVTGASSPWAETFQITSLPDRSEQGDLMYQVDFDVYTSDKSGKDRAIVTVSPKGKKWFVEAVAPADENVIGIWNTPESINEPNVEKTMKQMKAYTTAMGYSLSLPADVTGKIVLEQGTCSNEEGNPPCAHFLYQDKAGKKEPLLTVIRLSKEQEKREYYQEHPFLQKIGEGKNGSYYWMTPSEHPYAGNEYSEAGLEWSLLVEMLIERVNKASSLS